MPKKLELNRYPGFSTMECLAIGGTVCVVCIAALTVLGNVSGNSFKSIAGGMPKTVAPKATSPLTNITAPTSGNAGANGEKTSAGNPLFDASQATSFSSSVSNAIDASGANGATTQLADSLDIAIEQLLAQNAITPEEATNLRQLAYLGHQMAAAEALLENQFASSNGNLNVLSNAKYLYNGENYSFNGLVSELQLVGSNGNFTPGTSGSLAGKFQALQNSAVVNLQNPQAKEIIGGLSNKILSIADSTEGALHNAVNGTSGVSTTPDLRTDIIRWASLDPSNGKLPTSDKVTLYTSGPNSGSSQTDQASAAICTTGSGSDSGKNCK